MKKPKITNKTKGDSGEKDITKKIKCPNCRKKLMLLPASYPLFDIQCSACSFRAQVKTSHSKPKDTIFGAGWDIMDKVTKSGYLIPPLIVNYKWTEGRLKKQKVIFYPFIPKKSLNKRTLSKKAKRANYKMFNYTGLKDLPNFVLLSK